jgi:hypothetical protein
MYRKNQRFFYAIQGLTNAAEIRAFKKQKTYQPNRWFRLCVMKIIPLL